MQRMTSEVHNTEECFVEINNYNNLKKLRNKSRYLMKLTETLCFGLQNHLLARLFHNNVSATANNQHVASVHQQNGHSPLKPRYNDRPHFYTL